MHWSARWLSRLNGDDRYSLLPAKHRDRIMRLYALIDEDGVVRRPRALLMRKFNMQADHWDAFIETLCFHQVLMVEENGLRFSSWVMPEEDRETGRQGDGGINAPSVPYLAPAPARYASDTPEAKAWRKRIQRAGTEEERTEVKRQYQAWKEEAAKLAREAGDDDFETRDMGMSRQDVTSGKSQIETRDPSRERAASVIDVVVVSESHSNQQQPQPAGRVVTSEDPKAKAIDALRKYGVSKNTCTELVELRDASFVLAWVAAGKLVSPPLGAGGLVTALREEWSLPEVYLERERERALRVAAMPAAPIPDTPAARALAERCERMAAKKEADRVAG